MAKEPICKTISIPRFSKDEAIKKICEEIGGDYKDRVLTFIKSGTFANVYSAIKIKGPEEKNVAVRIVVTDRERILRQEKRPSVFFKNLKEALRGTDLVKDDTEEHESESPPTTKRSRLDRKATEKPKKEKPEYYKYINVPKLKYEINFTIPKESAPPEKAYGLVFESELANRDTAPQKMETAKPDNPLKKTEFVLFYIQRLIIDIANALKLLHSKGKIHNDIKPNNILVNENCDISHSAPREMISFKLSDFGLNWRIKKFPVIVLTPKDKDNILKTIEKFGFTCISNDFYRKVYMKFQKRCLQTEYYSAPEKTDALKTLKIFSDNIKKSVYGSKNLDQFFSDYNALVQKINTIGPASDIYSFGKTVTQIAMLQLKSSYIAEPKNTAKINLKKIFLNRLIDKMTQLDQGKRPSLDEILKNPYLEPL